WAVGTKKSEGIFGRFFKEGTYFILKTTNGGKSWFVQKKQSKSIFNFFGPVDGLNDVFFINKNIGWAVGLNRTILKTEDGGIHWFEQTIEKNNDFNFILSRKKNAYKFISKYAMTYSNFHSVSFIDSLNGLIVGLDGEVFKTTNGGIKWYPLNSGTLKSFNDLFIMPNRKVLIVGDGGVIQKYELKNF
ncbi:MAG: YCF48-related protein, partial [bacterium]